LHTFSAVAQLECHGYCKSECPSYPQKGSKISKNLNLTVEQNYLKGILFALFYHSKLLQNILIISVIHLLIQLYHKHFTHQGDILICNEHNIIALQQ